MDDYIQKTSLGLFDEAEDSIDKAKEEHGEVRTKTPQSEDQSQTMVPGENLQEMTDMTVNTETDRDETSLGITQDAEYARGVGFDTTDGTVDVKIPDEFTKAEEAKERLREVDMVNDELERQDSSRRYVVTESDVPDHASVHEDAFGKYYYKSLSIDLRPSDVAEYVGKEHHQALDESELAAGTVELLYSMDAQPLLDSKTIKSVTNWLERHMVFANEEPGDNDTFSCKFKNQIASSIAETNAEQKEG